MLKIKNKNGTRDENSSAQRMFKKNLYYKIKTSQRTVNNTLFIPPSFCVCQSFSTDALLACKYLETLSPSSLGDSEVVRLNMPIKSNNHHISQSHQHRIETPKVYREPTHPEPTSQDTLQISDPKIFISHIPILNFAGTDYTSHVCQP